MKVRHKSGREIPQRGETRGKRRKVYQREGQTEKSSEAFTVALVSCRSTGWKESSDLQEEKINR